MNNFFRCFRDFIKCLFCRNKISFTKSTNKNDYYDMEKENAIKIELINNEMNNDDVVKKLELQLHEQYATNNNSNVSSIISLIIGLIAVLGFYGYVYVYSTTTFASNWGELVFKKNDTTCCFKDATCCSEDATCYYLDVLILITMPAIIILNFIKHLCIYEGYYQRKEQFIVYAIRHKYYEGKVPLGDLYPKSYHPFKKRIENVPQGLFGEIIKICKYCTYFIYASLCCKIVVNVCQNWKYPTLSFNGMLELLCLAFVCIICCCHINRYNKIQYIGYLRLYVQYKDINPENDMYQQNRL